MAKGGWCTIYSLYKAHYGEENGNLLNALPNNKLCFDGTSTNPNTSFLRINKGKTCTFLMKQDGESYYICELNNSISLKQDGSNVFQIYNIPHTSIALIKARRSGLFLAADKNGRTIMKAIDERSIKDLKIGLDAMFIIDTVQDTIDGLSDPENTWHSSDANNNAVHSIYGAGGQENTIVPEYMPNNNQQNLMMETTL